MQSKSNIPITLISITTVFLFILVLVHHRDNHSSASPPSSSSLRASSSAPATRTCPASSRDSDGFFCEPDDYWARRKSIRDAQAARQVSSTYRFADGRPRSWPWFWQTFWEPDFSCPFERRIGSPGDGGKWMCDPHRVAELADPSTCLVYSIGSNNQWGFEAAVHEVLPQCEIHTFDHTVAEPRTPPYVTFHKFGVGPVDDPERKLFTIATLRKRLGHGSNSGKKIVAMKIDVEGWEYEALLAAMDGEKGKRGLDGVQQLYMEAHAPANGYEEYKQEPHEKVHKFFGKMAENGWVIFHKEANILAAGNCIEYGFFKTSWET